MKLFSNLSAPVRRISPTDGHYFFGYYDLQPYDRTGNLHLAHRTDFADRLQQRGDKAHVGLIVGDTNRFEPLAQTEAWNFQQGAMLQWNPRAADREIIYNDLLDGQQIGIIQDIHTGMKRYLDRPVANVSRDGRWALSINMSRLYDFRPGYGYALPADPFYYRNHSPEDGIFLTDMDTGRSRLILSMEEIWEYSGAHFSKDEKMVVNHITFNEDASRFLFLVRNFPPRGVRHDTALITCNRDGSELYTLSDYGVQSHYYWLDKEHLIIYSDGKELQCSQGWANNYLMKDKTHEGTIQADGYFWFDNHMSFSPDKKWMITDTYPDDVHRMQTLQIYNPEQNVCVELGRFYSPPVSTTDIRCDLHPRWNRTGSAVTFDSTHEGFRGIYATELTPSIRKLLGNAIE